MVDLVGGPCAGKRWPMPPGLSTGAGGYHFIRVPVPAHKQDPQPMPSAAWPLFALYEARDGGHAAAFVRYEGETDEEVRLRRAWESIPPGHPRPPREQHFHKVLGRPKSYLTWLPPPPKDEEDY